MMRFPKKDTGQPKQDAGPYSTHKSKLVMPVGRSGVMEAEQPSTKNILKRLLPMTFPMAISGFFFKAATMEVASSGNEVPPATSVKPDDGFADTQSAGYAAGTVYKEGKLPLR